jgi:predicted DNA binding protein
MDKIAELMLINESIEFLKKMEAEEKLKILLQGPSKELGDAIIEDEITNGGKEFWSILTASTEGRHLGVIRDLIKDLKLKKFEKIKSFDLAVFELIKEDLTK